MPNIVKSDDKKRRALERVDRKLRTVEFESAEERFQRLAPATQRQVGRMSNLQIQAQQELERMKREEKELHEQLKQKSEMYRKMLDLQLKQKLCKRHIAEYGVALKKLVEIDEIDDLHGADVGLQTGELEQAGVLELPPSSVVYEVH